MTTRAQSDVARRVAAIVVTYHPSPKNLEQLLRAITPQIQGILIIDNTPGAGAELPHISSNDVAVIRNGANVGLAAAQNQGVQWGATRGFTHVLILDQDSIPGPDCVARLYEAARGLSEKGVAVGVVGPRVLDNRTARAYSFKRFTFTGIKHSYCQADADVIATDFVIASGSLIAIDALRAIGPMDEGLFIDRIDIDWCLRAAALGYGVYGVCGARLQHEPGEHSRRIWIGRWTEAAVHSPERNYYMIRNSMLLYRKAYAPLRWILNDILWLSAVVVASCVVAPARLRRLRLVVKGIWDGVRGVRGPLGANNKIVDNHSSV
jgi:rhamnosyltransferase